MLNASGTITTPGCPPHQSGPVPPSHLSSLSELSSACRRSGSRDWKHRDIIIGKHTESVRRRVKREENDEIGLRRESRGLSNCQRHVIAHCLLKLLQNTVWVQFLGIGARETAVTGAAVNSLALCCHWHCAATGTVFRVSLPFLCLALLAQEWK